MRFLGFGFCCWLGFLNLIGLDFDFFVEEESSGNAALQACPVYVAAVDLSCKINWFLYHFSAYACDHCDDNRMV